MSDIISFIKLDKPLRRSVNEKRVLVPLPVEPSMVTELLHVTPVSKRPVNQIGRAHV